MLVTTVIEFPFATSSEPLFLFLHHSVVSSSCLLVWAWDFVSISSFLAASWNSPYFFVYPIVTAKNNYHCSHMPLGKCFFVCLVFFNCSSLIWTLNCDNVGAFFVVVWKLPYNSAIDIIRKASLFFYPFIFFPTTVISLSFETSSLFQMQFQK